MAPLLIGIYWFGPALHSADRAVFFKETPYHSKGTPRPSTIVGLGGPPGAG